jgi:hypothetical protein
MLAAGNALLAGCQSATERRQVFVEQHYADDFRQFRGVHLFVRGRDDAGNWRLALTCRAGNATQSDPMVWISVAPTDSVVAVRHADALARCRGLDSTRAARLVRAFLRYKLSALSADEVGHVSFGFVGDGTGSTELTRVQDSSQVGPYFWEDYTRIRGPWYGRREPR